MPWLDWLSPLLILIVSLLVGLWVQRFLVPRLLRLASQIPWEGDEIVIRAIRGPTMLWSLMAGVYLAMRCSQAPDAVVGVAGRVLTVLWILSVTWVSTNAASQLITQYASKRQVALPMTSLTKHLTTFVILALGVLISLDSMGVRIGSLLAALGIGSLAVALGLQDTLANLFAGISLTVSKYIRVGDYIKLEGGEEGYVTDIGWRVTRIHRLPNNIVIVPNTKLSQSVITNYDLPEKEVAVLVNVGVDYASDLERVERITVEVAREVMRTVPGGVPTFEPLVRYQAFGDFGVNFTVVMRAREFVEQYLIIHDFIKRLHARYQQDGILTSSPIRALSTGSIELLAKSPQPGVQGPPSPDSSQAR